MTDITYVRELTTGGIDVTKRKVTFAATLAVLGLVAGACSESSDSSSSTEAPAVSEAPTSDAPTTDAPGDSPISEANLAHALEYTGGPGGVASGDPVVIGYVNQEGGTPAFPEASIGIDSAVWYANNFLGGIGGRPIELAKCTVTKEEDGQKCAQEMLANEDVQLVITGAMLNGNQPLLDGLAGQKPVYIANPVTTPEFLATDAFAFTPGSPGVVAGLAVFAAKYVPELEGITVDTVAVVYNDNPAGQIAFSALTKPVLEGLGVANVKGVAVSDTAGPQEMATAIQSAGAEDADVFYPLVTISSCIGVYDALKTLEIDTVVVTTGLCFGVPMQNHLKEVGEAGNLPDGWYFGGYGYSYEIAGDPSTDAYLEAVFAWANELGKDAATLEYTGFALPTFGTLMTAIQFLNGGASDAESFRTAAKAFAGPQWGVVGPMKCGGNPTFPSLCGFQIGIQQQQGTEYVSIRDGYNGDPIDPQADLAG
jgi:branched-chain amino acid transport system substrate-binding protein